MRIFQYIVWGSSFSLQWVKRCSELIIIFKPASENVICLCCLLNILANFSNLFLQTGKQCEPWSDCSWRSSLLWVHTVCKKWNHKQMTKQTMVVIGSYCRYHIYLSIWTDRPEQKCRPWSDATEYSIWSGSTLFTIHPAGLVGISMIRI